jgi:hypothetical protein
MRQAAHIDWRVGFANGRNSGNHKRELVIVEHCHQTLPGCGWERLFLGYLLS